MRTTPIPPPDASISTIDTFWKSNKANIGVEIKDYFNSSEDACACSF